MRVILLIIGSISAILGFIGVIMPLLPTTPFLLLAGLCFARSSERFHSWLIRTKPYQAYVEDFRKYRGYTMTRKIELLISVYIVVGFSIYMIDHFYIRLGLCLMLCLQTIVLIFFVKTLPEGDG
ncbi:DUF454 domain-containing protein [Macrococcus equipercicus]|uniref:DUF454 domain-containing protein n=1 Tax=Macrococcus equipercicus TaxID=69967 RepID=A0ABQ6R6M3_9STAP|nr:DUF454 family protein [Macrococcus equipercicus]KAA1036940.1 DUF454 domain-containing protein [Macrococcus equipercicus]